MLKNVVKIKITTDTDDLRAKLDDLYRATETLRENLEQAVGAINLSDPDMREEWGMICDVKSACADALHLVAQIDNLRGRREVDTADGTIGWWFDLYYLPAEITMHIINKMDSETLVHSLMLDWDRDAYLVTHTDDVVDAIREYLPVWEEKMMRIQEMEQQARRDGKRRNTCGWSKTYELKEQTALEL